MRFFLITTSLVFNLLIVSPFNLFEILSGCNHEAKSPPSLPRSSSLRVPSWFHNHASITKLASPGNIHASIDKDKYQLILLTLIHFFKLHPFNLELSLGINLIILRVILSVSRDTNEWMIVKDWLVILLLQLKKNGSSLGIDTNDHYTARPNQWVHISNVYIL